ncbi:GAF domain-containing protein, partial [Staphylococcus aureus]
WHKAEANPDGEVILPDTAQDYILSEYPVPDRDPRREELYRSVASIPILIRHNNEVWGVVTATSNRPGVFDRSGPGLQ